MATAVLRHSASDRPAQSFQWTRSSAISVTLAAHALAALLILAPPAMEPVEKHPTTSVEPIVLIPEKKEEPVIPVQKLEVKPFVPKPTPVPRPETAPTPPIVTEEATPMSLPDPVAPPAPDPGPTMIEETVPTPLGYGAGSKAVAYPRDAIRDRHEGTVILRVKIGTDGTPLDVVVETSSGHASLDRAARTAVMKWRFTPGTRNGQPFVAWGLVPIAFKLNQL